MDAVGTTRSGSLVPVALTMGEPAGIGAEITLKAWQALRSRPTPFVLLDDAERVRIIARRFAPDVDVRTVADPAAAATVFPTALPVMDRPLPNTAVLGRPDSANAEAVLDSIREAVRL